MTNPIAYWRTYLGGGLGAGQLVTVDANGDSTPDLVTVTGGAVSARSVNDEIFWKTPPRGIGGISGVADLDGDGAPDIVAQSSNHVFVISARTGAIEWVEPDAEIGTMGSVRVGDVNGDGKPDVVVTECGCCGVNSGKSGFIWSFGAGFGAAAELGSIPVFSCGTSYSVTLADADGNNRDEILLADYDHFALLDGSGAILAATVNQGPWTSLNECMPVDLDGKPGLEFVCLLNSNNLPQTNERKVTVLQYNPTVQPVALNILWSKVVAPDMGGDMQWLDPVEDLDGDGKYEVILSTLDPKLGWQTRIFDALDGTEFTPPIGSNAIVAGTAAMEAPNKRLVLTATSDGTDLIAWSFVRSSQQIITQRWQLSNRTLMTYAKPELLAETAMNRVPVALDLNGDGLEDIVTRTPSGPSDLIGYSGAGGTTSIVGAFTLPLGTEPQSAWLLSGVVASGRQVALVGTDGVLKLLGSTLQPMYRTDDTSKTIGVRVGGYYASGSWLETSNAPRMFPLDGKVDAIVVPDSRKALNRFDGVSASWAISPPPTWSLAHTYAATIAPKLDGAKPGMACVAIQEPITNPPQYRTRAVRVDGSIIWDVPMPSNPLSDMVSGDFNGDGVLDFAIQWAAPTSVNIQTKAISGIDGSTLWSTQPMFPGVAGFQSPGISVGRYDGDTIDDVYFQGAPTRVLSGINGSEIVQAGNTSPYALPVLVDTNHDNSDEVLVTSGYQPVSLYTHDLQTSIWSSSDDDRPYPYPGVAECGANPSIPTLVQGSWAHPARLKLSPLAGANLGVIKTVVLANGKMYLDEAEASADGAYLGQLTSANVHTNLTGKNRPTAVVGSLDGWVYGINPCDGTLDFAIDIGAATGEVVFGDTDGDGFDEMVVTAADGYLYDIKNEAIPKPSFVWDTDPDNGIVDHDIDTIVTTDKLSAVWASVASAIGYEVTVVNKIGQAVLSPPWKDVGNVTAVSLVGLPLIAGTQYFFVVRALSAKGPSVDALSNGVVVVGGSVDGGGDAGVGLVGGGGCGCTLAPRDGSWWSLGGFGTVVALALARGRQRRSKDSKGCR